MRALAASQSGSPDLPNEDWVTASADLVVVLDGATSRTESGCTHGVAWYVNKLGAAIVGEAADHSNSLKDCLAIAISCVAGLHPECDLDHPGAPSAAVGIVRRRERALEVLVLADVSVAIQLVGGEIRVLTDRRADNVVSDQLDQALALPIKHSKRPSALRKVKKQQQAYRNRPGGFFVAASDPTAASESITAEIQLDKVLSVALVSDGATRAIDLFQKLSWSDLFSVVQRSGPAHFLKLVRDIEAQDPEATRWPRSKVSDDATIAYLQVTDSGTDLHEATPERKFFGIGPAELAVPLRSDTSRSFPMLAAEDDQARQLLTEQLTGMAIPVTHTGIRADRPWVPVSHNLIAICGPKSSTAITAILENDPVLAYEAGDDGKWTIRDRRTGRIFASPMDDGQHKRSDVAYLGRLPFDEHRDLLLVAGVHAIGSLGAVHFLRQQLPDLYTAVGTARFSIVIASNYEDDLSITNSWALCEPILH